MPDRFLPLMMGVVRVSHQMHSSYWRTLQFAADAEGGRARIGREFVSQHEEESRK